MSAYMSFFIRANDSFYPIGTYSRSTAIYEMFGMRAGVPWEQIIPINNNLKLMQNIHIGYITLNFPEICCNI